jgi:proline iminopeptidase
MRAKIRDTEIYFDIDGAGLVIEGDRMKERPVAFLVHGGPGAIILLTKRDFLT